MASSFFLLHTILTRRRDSNTQSHTLKSFFFFMPTTLALATSFLILFYISSTSNLFFIHPHHLHITHHPIRPSIILENPPAISTFAPPEPVVTSTISDFAINGGVLGETEGQEKLKKRVAPHLVGKYINDKKLFHDKDFFLDNYKEMNRSLKIYVYPHGRDDPFANVLLPVDFEPEGNYASESYFKKVLMKSHFITKNPSKANLFFLPFSIARLRHDPRVGIDGIQDFIRDYIFNITHQYPYWNRTGGADHFYVACHSIGRSAMEKAIEVKLNAIQVVCSSSYYLSSYVAHKDASLPQIWPRQGDPPNLAIERTKLAFFAGSMNSPVREKLLQVWRDDSEISVHFGHLKTSYAEELLASKFCLQVKGFEVNTARIGDALYYGCVPVIIANHYDLPFQDILNWQSFSVVVATLDIPLLKKILRGISIEEYLVLQRNVLKVREHFQWHLSPVDLDAFYMVMYELWLRRSTLRVTT
ncbi:Exostosin family protein [Abeliophyllum distichum]|uniref:Exostosin family protein n=1 Tax=Abeliophyllum distichum TaxID=126358 RepID=A0ABD1NXK1_9LAMI